MFIIPVVANGVNIVSAREPDGLRSEEVVSLCFEVSLIARGYHASNDWFPVLEDGSSCWGA